MLLRVYGVIESTYQSQFVFCFMFLDSMTTFEKGRSLISCPGASTSRCSFVLLSIFSVPHLLKLKCAPQN